MTAIRVGDVVAGRYELEQLVGTGGMSTVYRAHDRLLERNVALKLLHPHFGDDEEYVERFRREARAVARLSHPNLVTVIDRGEDDGREFIVFEYVPGETLKQLVERHGPLSVQRALELAIEIGDGLAFAHEHGIVHRDVKPQNVLLDADGHAKVTDFGIARSLDVERGFTQTGTVLGTSNYLSPEQASGKPVTPATDVYSLGIVLFELLDGDVPFPASSAVAAAMRQLNEAPPDVRHRRPDVSDRLAAAVDRALEKDPGRRFRRMDDFTRELRACLAETERATAEHTLIRPPAHGAAPPPARPGALPRRTGRRLPLALALLGAVLVAAVVAALVLRHHGGPGGKGAATGPGTATATLRGVSGYDPQGSDGEHDADAAKATDGDAATYWQTQTYASPAFGGLKTGVGLVLDAGSDAKLSRLAVTTTTPGFQARVEAGNSPDGGFASDSALQTVGRSTTFELSGVKARYYVLWITRLPPGGVAYVNEVRAS